MKNIKNLVKTLFLLPLVLLTGCQDDEYVAPGSFTDLSITWSSGASGIRESEVNRFFTFSDLSAGAEQHQWSIPENAFFLNGPIPNNLDNHDAYIADPADAKVSTDITVHVLWKKGDSNTKVRYFGIFSEYTEFDFNRWDADLAETITDTIKTQNIDGKWIADYEFIIDVYDTVVAKPEVRYLDGTILDYGNTESLNVKFGDTLVLEDLSAFVDDNNARPDYTRFRVHTLEENEEDWTYFATKSKDPILREGDYDIRITDTLIFGRLGDFGIRLLARRERTERVKASEDIFDISTIFKVVPLTEDLVQLGTVIERDDDRIDILISSPLSDFEENPAGDFTVKIDGASVAVESVTKSGQVISGKRYGRISLILETPLVPEDAAKVVTVSYSGTDIISGDERVLQPFTDISIDVYVPTPMSVNGPIVEADNDIIQITFSQELDPASISGSVNPAAGFIIGLNGGSGTVQSVSVNDSNPKTLDITLVEGVYQNDVITVAYSGPGDIRSIGGGAIADFTDVTIELYIANLLSDSDNSFEGTYGSYWVEGASGAGATVEFSTDYAHTGSQSVKMTALKPRLESGSNLSYEVGTYIVSYWRYIPSTVTAPDVAAVFDDAFHSKNHGDKIWLDSGSGATAVTPRWYGENYPNGTAPPYDIWEYVEVEKDITAEAFNKKIRFQPVPTSGTDYTVYYDDLKIYKKEFRP
jgi:uncharacterized repeat protein (TIGR02059 family)